MFDAAFSSPEAGSGRALHTSRLVGPGNFALRCNLTVKGICPAQAPQNYNALQETPLSAMPLLLLFYVITPFGFIFNFKIQNVLNLVKNMVPPTRILLLQTVHWESPWCLGDFFPF